MAIITLEVTLSDGSVVEAYPTLQDTLAFETTLRKNKGWGPLQDNALKLHPFQAWNALRRAGTIDLSWEEFTSGSTAALAVSPKRDTDDDPEEFAPGSPDELAARVGLDTTATASTPSSSPSPSAPTSSRAPGSKKTQTT